MLRRRKRLLIWITYRGMRKVMGIAVLVSLLIAFLLYDFSTTQTWTHWTMPLSGKVIVVDAGHGGVDGGAESATGLIEKQVALNLAVHLRDYLQQAGAVVYLTREEDTDLARPDTKGYSKRKSEDLIQRARLIKSKTPDMFISLHLNSVPSSRWRGAQTFYYPGREEGKRLASFIQEELRVTLNNTDRLANTQNTMFLLRAIEVPSALVEVGFLSNPQEAKLLGDTEYQKKLAAAVYRGVLRYSSGETLGSE